MASLLCGLCLFVCLWVSRVGVCDSPRPPDLPQSFALSCGQPKMLSGSQGHFVRAPAAYNKQKWSGMGPGGEGFGEGGGPPGLAQNDPRDAQSRSLALHRGHKSTRRPPERENKERHLRRETEKKSDILDPSTLRAPTLRAFTLAPPPFVGFGTGAEIYFLPALGCPRIVCLTQMSGVWGFGFGFKGLDRPTLSDHQLACANQLRRKNQKKERERRRRKRKRKKKRKKKKRKKKKKKEEKKTSKKTQKKANKRQKNKKQNKQKQVATTTKTNGKINMSGNCTLHNESLESVDKDVDEIAICSRNFLNG